MDLRVMEGRREHLIQHTGVDPVPVGGDLDGGDAGPIDRSLEEAAGRFGVPARGEEDVDDPAELVDGPEQVAPRSSDLHVGLIDVPAISDDVLPSPGGLRELWREPLDPPVDAHVIDLDPTLREKLLDVSVGKTEPQVPADRQGDDLGREPIPGERRCSALVGQDDAGVISSRESP